MRREWSYAAALTAAGAALRLFHLGTQSLWLDELFSVFLSQRGFVAIIRDTAKDTMPPLYYLLLRIAMQFGSDERAVRSVSFIFSVATIPLFYVLARDMFGHRVALAATLILVFNPFHLFYAQEARMYAQLAFFSLAAIFFFWRAWHRRQRRDWIAFGFAATLAIYTHTLAVLTLFALDMFAVWRREELKRRWESMLVSHLMIGLLLAPWISILWQQVERVRHGFWMTFPSPLSLLTIPTLFLLGTSVPTLFVPVGLFVSLALFGLAFWHAARTLANSLPDRSSESDSAALQLSLALLLVPPLSLLALSLVRPIFLPRTLIASSFGVYLLIGWMLVHRNTIVETTLAGSFFLLVGIALTGYYFVPAFQKPPMREAAQALMAQWQAGDVAIHTSDSSALAFAYYAPSIPTHFLAGDPDYLRETTRGQSGRVAGLIPEEREGIVADHTRVWLIVALDHNQEYQRSRVHEFDRLYRRVTDRNVGGIDLLLYEAHK